MGPADAPVPPTAPGDAGDLVRLAVVRGHDAEHALADLVRLAIVVRGRDAERALADLVALAPAGFEERAAGEDVEYALYGAPDELPGEGELRALLGGALVGVRVDAVRGDWQRRWHEFLRPATVREGGRSLTIRPPWIEGSPDDVVIDPGTTFGAGTHATTRLCLRLLLGTDDRGGLVDWGAGSGILAVAAARLGFAPVLAVEIDPDAADVIRANAAANAVAVQVATLDLAAGPPPWAPTVCANLTLELLVDVAARLGRPPERLVASGVLAGRAGEVAAAFAPLGLREARRLEEDGWAALLLERR